MYCPHAFRTFWFSHFPATSCKYYKSYCTSRALWRESPHLLFTSRFCYLCCYDLLESAGWCRNVYNLCRNKRTRQDKVWPTYCKPWVDMTSRGQADSSVIPYSQYFLCAYTQLSWQPHFVLLALWGALPLILQCNRSLNATHPPWLIIADLLPPPTVILSWSYPSRMHNKHSPVTTITLNRCEYSIRFTRQNE